MQKDSSKVFTANAQSLFDLYLSEGGQAGFRIPLYQRDYDWGKENIKRLIEDISLGLRYLASDDESLTFLGTVIFLIESTDEPDFDGSSLSVIDGQQRLTTLSLLATVLYEEMAFSDVLKKEMPPKVAQWLANEINYIKTNLLVFIRGNSPISGNEFFQFPRVVREEKDNRAKSFASSEYKSLIGKYLFDFAQHVSNSSPGRFTHSPYKSSEATESFMGNIETLKEYVAEIGSSLQPSTFRFPDQHELEKGAFRKLFKKLPNDLDQAQSIISYCKNHESLHGIYRIALFSHYLMNAVIVTVVKTTFDKYAFDIFDSLNTTGEPLTAIQTFKPQVIKFEKESSAAYVGSPSEEHFKQIEGYLNKFSGTDKKQREAKEIVVNFALYMAGEKLTLNLDPQRRFLYSTFNSLSPKTQRADKRQYVKHLSDVVDYRDRFWMNKTIKGQLPNYPDREKVLLCLQFLSELKTSLTIPILCRYFAASKDLGSKKLFSDAVLALTAFVVLRRSATGGTAGIDSDLRGVMDKGAAKPNNVQSQPLSIGLKNTNSLVTIADLKKYLKSYLAQKRIEIVDKHSWRLKLRTTPVAEASGALSKILLFFAYHNARLVPEHQWQYQKARSGMEVEFLDISRWSAKDFETVEHIAPQRPGVGL